MIGISYGGVYKSTDSGGSWSAVNTGLSTPATGNAHNISALAIDPTTPSTVYAATVDIVGDLPGNGVFVTTDGGGSWSAVNSGLSGNALWVSALAIDPSTPSALYAGTDGGVFDIEPGSGGPMCPGDCDAAGSVTVDELITLVNIDLGTTDASACPNGIPSGVSVDMTLIIQAVNNALGNCATA